MKHLGDVTDVCTWALAAAGTCNEELETFPLSPSSEPSVAFALLLQAPLHTWRS